MSSGNVQQENNDVHGDMAARDINKTVIIYAPSLPTRISELNDRYEDETEEEKTLNGYIRELNHFSGQLPYAQKDLQTKLSDAQRDSELDEALYLKELISKRILEFTRSPTAQRIMAEALAKLKQCFQHKVKPLIECGQPKHVIDAAIYDNVICPAYVFLERNPLGISEEDLKGMIYYLAGNCHINWGEEC